MVLAFAGDSTITSEVLPGSDGVSSSYCGSASARLRAAVFAGARPAGALRAPAVLRAEVFLRVAMLVHRHLVGSIAATLAQPGALDERPDVLERDAPVDLPERAIDHVLQLGGGEDATGAQREQVTPGIRGEAPA